jgi:hypothetical protein
VNPLPALFLLALSSLPVHGFKPLLLLCLFELEVMHTHGVEHLGLALLIRLFG